MKEFKVKNILFKVDGSAYPDKVAARLAQGRERSRGVETVVEPFGDGFVLVETGETKMTQQKRRPIGTRNLLPGEDKDPNFKYRVVNDETQTQRLRKFEEAWYEYVRVGDAGAMMHDRAGMARVLGDRIAVPVGSDRSGKPMNGYLMRIRKDLYEKDQADKQRKVDESESDMTRTTKKDGMYGEIDLGNMAKKSDMDRMQQEINRLTEKLQNR